MAERRMPSPEDMGIAKTEKEKPPYKILSNEQSVVSQISRESLYKLAEEGDPNAFTKVGIVTYRKGMSRRSGRLDMVKDRLSAVTLSPEVNLEDEKSLDEMARELAKDRVSGKRPLKKLQWKYDTFQIRTSHHGKRKTEKQERSEKQIT